MKRRTLLGSAAMTLGGASVIGTGAFTSVKAERSLSVDVVGDESAFLQLEPGCGIENDIQSSDESGGAGGSNAGTPPQSSDFVYNKNDDTIAIDLTESIAQNGAGNISGEGITGDSLWRFPNAFKIKNQGTQPVCIDLQVQNNDGQEITLNSGGEATVGGDNVREFSESDPAVVFYPGTNDTRGNLFNNEDTDGLLLNPPGADSPGSQCIGFNVRTFGFGSDSVDNPLEDAKLIITADAGGACRENREAQPQPGLGVMLDSVDSPDPSSIDGSIIDNTPSAQKIEETIKIRLEASETEKEIDIDDDSLRTAESGFEFNFDLENVELGPGKHTAVVTATAEGVAPVSDSVEFVISGDLDAAGKIVYQTNSSNGGSRNLKTIAGDGGKITDLGVADAQAIGPATADITGNGLNDLPYVDADGNLKLVDNNGDKTTLVNKSEVEEEQRPDHNKTLLVVGMWDGTGPSVFYSNQSHSKIYRVSFSSDSPTEVADPTDGVNAIIGIGDIDGDGENELLFVDGSQHIRYLDKEQDSPIELENGGTESDNGIGVGSIAEFGGSKYVIFISNNEIKLVNDVADDDTITISPSGNKKPAKSPPTVASVDGSSGDKIVYISNDKRIKYIPNPTGDQSIKDLKNQNENTIKADDSIGVTS